MNGKDLSILKRTMRSLISQNPKSIRNYQTNRWVDVNVCIPKKGQRVLIHATGGRLLTSVYDPYNDNKFYCYDLTSGDIEKIENPTHWMYLPQLPLC